MAKARRSKAPAKARRPKELVELRKAALKDCPQSTIEEVFGYPRKTLQIFKKDGMPFRKIGGRLSYDLCKVGRWLHDRYRGRGARDSSASSSTASPALERRREVDADRAKWDFEVALKLWEEKAEVERREVEIATAVRHAFEQLGRELAPRLVGKSSAREVKSIVDDAVDSRLKQLSGRKG